MVTGGKLATARSPATSKTLTISPGTLLRLAKWDGSCNVQKFCAPMLTTAKVSPLVGKITFTGAKAVENVVGVSRSSSASSCGVEAGARFVACVRPWVQYIASTPDRKHSCSGG